MATKTGSSFVGGALKALLGGVAAAAFMYVATRGPLVFGEKIEASPRPAPAARAAPAPTSPLLPSDPLPQVDLYSPGQGVDALPVTQAREKEINEYYRAAYEDSIEFRQGQLADLRRSLNQVDENLEESTINREAVDRIEREGRMVW